MRKHKAPRMHDSQLGTVPAASPCLPWMFPEAGSFPGVSPFFFLFRQSPRRKRFSCTCISFFYSHHSLSSSTSRPPVITDPHFLSLLLGPCPGLTELWEWRLSCCSTRSGCWWVVACLWERPPPQSSPPWDVTFPCFPVAYVIRLHALTWHSMPRLSASGSTGDLTVSWTGFKPPCLLAFSYEVSVAHHAFP